MRKNIVAGNWKMNNNLPETEELISELKKFVQTSDTEVLIAPSYISLNSACEILNGTNIEVIAQNMHFAENGAFTGEISAEMLKSVGIKTVILGHSERRENFNEDEALLKQKVNTGLQNGLRIIFCFGEKIEDRSVGNHFIVVEKQIRNVLFHLSEDKWSSLILAYEPIWAIGTGETASPEQAQEMHAFIRSLISEKYNNAVAENVSILYGGSVKPENANEIFIKPDVDGGLIGGASLNAKSFMAIVNSF